MDLRQLRHFVTVAETLHFGRAAEKLNMTQPPLSQSIQALEATLGVQLFARTRRSVALTPVGAEWLPYARKILAEAAALPDIALRLSRGEVGALRLAFVSTATYSVMPPLISRYKALYPEVELSLREATGDVQIDWLLDGDVDAGLLIAAPQPIMPPQLGYRPLYRERLVAVVPEAWVESGRIVAKRGRLGFDQMREAPLIVFPRQSAPALHDLITGYYIDGGVTPAIVQEAVQMQTIIGLVSAAIGMALVPDSMRGLARPGVVYLPPARKSPAMETGLAWRTDRSPPTLRRLLAIAGESATEPRRADP